MTESILKIQATERGVVDINKIRTYNFHREQQ